MRSCMWSYPHATKSRQLPPLRKLDAFSKSAHSGIDSVTLLFKPLTLIPEVLQGNEEGLDELVIFELRLRILVLW
jgi:hypothetical protein